MVCGDEETTYEVVLLCIRRHPVPERTVGRIPITNVIVHLHPIDKENGGG